MFLFPAIDLYEGKVVRLFKGNYNQMTVFSDNPCNVAHDFSDAGASHIHIVDLEGAKNGNTPNLDTIRDIVRVSGLFSEVGGGIRNLETIKNYIDIGVNRVILGTAAVTDPVFLEKAISMYGDRIAVGVDIRDGYVSIKGWTENSGLKADDFCYSLQAKGVKTIICTDISRDGAMQGANHKLYQKMTKQYNLDLIASGGVSSLNDIITLKEIGMYGTIIGKAYYNGSISLKEAIEVAR